MEEALKLRDMTVGGRHSEVGQRVGAIRIRMGDDTRIATLDSGPGTASVGRTSKVSVVLRDVAGEIGTVRTS